MQTKSTTGRPPACLVALLCYNTCNGTGEVLKKFPKERNYDLLLVNDGSTDNTRKVIENAARFLNCAVIHHPVNCGVGAAIKTAVKYAINNKYEVIVILAGNNKDSPHEIPVLLKPILEEGYDYVQGSRFVKGGRWDNLPLFRYVMVKVHAWIFSLITGFRSTDSLNGFRAFRLDIFKDKTINIWQDWLDHYELETYFHYKILKSKKYRIKEVPVSKIYPPRWKKMKYTHIRPFIDWWIIMRPLVYLFLRIKK